MKIPAKPLVTRAARLLMGSTFVMLGSDAARTPGGRADQAAPLLARMRTVLPLPEDDELLVRANGGAQALAGGLLALGRCPRLAAAVIGASLIPTTLAGHAFWTEEDAGARAAQRTQFLKNSAMLGGMLLVVALDGRQRRGAR